MDLLLKFILGDKYSVKLKDFEWMEFIEMYRKYRLELWRKSEMNFGFLCTLSL